jgi:hypothetical protein
MKKSLVLVLAAFFAAPALADHTEFAIERAKAFTPSLRLGIDIAPRGEEMPSVPHPGHGIEVGLYGTSGDDTQTRTAGAPPLTFGGQVFSAPTTLNHEFDFGLFEIAYRYRLFFHGTTTFGLELLGGLGFAEMDLTVSSPTQRASENLQSGGLVAGVGIVWKFLPRTSLQSRLMFFGSGEREGITSAARFELMLAHALARNIAVRAGLTGWGVESERDAEEDFGSPNSHIRAGFGGFALGLDIAF